MQRCSKCQANTRQNKAGTTNAGSQRYRCMHCQRKYTPLPKHHGYPESLRNRATEMYEEVKEAEMDEILTFIGDKKTESTF